MGTKNHHGIRIKTRRWESDLEMRPIFADGKEILRWKKDFEMRSLFQNETKIQRRDQDLELETQVYMTGVFQGISPSYTTIGDFWFIASV